MNDFKIYITSNEDLTTVDKIQLPNGEVIVRKNERIELTKAAHLVDEEFILVINGVEEKNILLYAGTNVNGEEVIVYDTPENFNSALLEIENIPEFFIEESQ
ncbi:hypothetical protein D3C81_1140010 [compost metagenome]